MKPSGNRQVRRWIDAMLLDRASPTIRRRLRQRLRADPDARAEYDGAVGALRALANDAEFASVELDLVEQWLLDDLPPASSTPSASPLAGRWRWLGVVGMVCALLLLWWWVPPDREQASTMTPKGMQGSVLALDATCVADEPEASPTLTSAPDQGCARADVLVLSYRIASQNQGDKRWLTLFGVDQRGRVLHYAPTPADQTPIAPQLGRWTPVERGVRLHINHAPGTIRVYGLLSSVPPTLRQIESWAEVLALHDPAAFGTRPWHRRLDRRALQNVCDPRSRCESAELTFVYGDRR